MSEINIKNLKTFKNTLEEIITGFTEDEKPLKNELIQGTISKLLSDNKFYTKDGLKQLKRYKSDLINCSIDDLLTDSSFVEILGYHSLKQIFIEEDGYEIIFKIGSTIFPDITIKKGANIIGFELKRMTDEEVLGNSVTQSLKEKFNEIFSICFYENGNKIHVSKYEDIINSIKVDHNPRFSLKINPDGNTVLPCSLVEYFEFDQNSKEELVAKFIAENFKSDEYRWYQGYGKKSVIEFIKEISNKPDEGELDKIRADVFANFPDKIFTSSNYHWLRVYILESFMILGTPKDWFTSNSTKNDPIIYRHFERLLKKIDKIIDKDKKYKWKETVKENLKIKIGAASNSLTDEQYEKLLESIDKCIK